MTEDGPISVNRLKPEELRMKLAMHGVDDEVLVDVMSMKEGQEKKLYGLKYVAEKAKKEPETIPSGELGSLKVAAEEALKAVDEADDAKSDPQVLDAVLSLQFVSEESLRDLLGADQLFEEVEDKLSRLLLASRQGEKSIHEQGVARALKGIGEAQKSLKTLAIELDDREKQ